MNALDLGLVYKYYDYISFFSNPQITIKGPFRAVSILK